MRKVVCAAIRAEDGCLLVGIRHYSADMYAQLVKRKDAEKFYHRFDADQGFVDQFGVYMTRTEAYKVAVASGQVEVPEDQRYYEIHRSNNKLFSEDLY